MTENSVLYKKLESYRIASVKTCIDSRDQIPALLDHLRSACGDAINGDAVIIFHGGAVKEGSLVEAAFPVTHRITTVP